MEHQYEVLIVGAGGAGLYAALEASERAKTAVLSKLYPIRSHTGAQMLKEFGFDNVCVLDKARAA